MTRRAIEFDRAEFNASFNRKPFRAKHNLVGHPLFQIPRLLELSKKLPEDDVEYNAGNVPVGLDPEKTPRTGLSVEETIRRIETANSWLVLKRVNRDPEYRALLEECLSSVEAMHHPVNRGIYDRVAFIFITSPHGVTPLHLDPEINFLLQIQGTKQMTVFDPNDRLVLPEDVLERYLAGGHRNVVYKDEYQARANVFEMSPGDSVHVPVTAPHWVKNGPGVSVSFSITYRTRVTERRSNVYTVNHFLRKRGMTPAPFGENALRDAMKHTALRVVRRARILLGKDSAWAAPTY